MLDMKKLLKWHQVQTELKTLKEIEAVLRKELFEASFPAPHEGVNKLELNNGWLLKGNYKLYRKIDEAALGAVVSKLPEGSKERLVRYNPSLNLKEYKKLVDVHRTIFDEALIIKPGSPSLDIMLPASAKADD